jgi:hypothetical protein
MRTVVLFVLLTLFINAGCQETDFLTPGISVEDLLQTPETLSIDGRQFILESYLWRDFMPISPPDGKPLIAIIWIVASDSLAVPAHLEADRIYVVFSEDVWESELAVTGSSSEVHKLERIARNGPKWGPDVFVDVIVRVLFDGDIYYVRASDQMISRTD